MKELPEISLCYYPTTSVLVDDDKKILTSTCMALFKNNQLPCYFFESPSKALDFLNNKEPLADSAMNEYVTRDDEESSIWYEIVKLDFTAIHKLIYQPERFALLSNLIVDYAMPEMNGAELCQQVQNSMIMKNMLTGEADKDMAVAFFNDKKIDKFLMKNSPNLIEKLLPQTIHEMQQRFFIELTQKALNQVSTSEKILVCLSDPAFIELFNALREKAQAVEYYLLDNQGSFLFLDKDAKPSWFIVVTEEEMEAYYQIASYDDTPKEILESLKNKTGVLFFPTGQVPRPYPPTWGHYLYPAKVLEGEIRYYYAYITNPREHGLKLDQVVPYQTYLDKFYQKYLKLLSQSFTKR